MQTEIITIGDEILIGQIVDTNSAWMAQQLNSIGIKVNQITSVPDRMEHILDAFKAAESRADIILITGGLGPTSDDLTKPALCNYFNSDLRFDETAYQDIEALFRSRGKEVTPINRQQAEVPQLCKTIYNKNGTAPGMWFDKNQKVFVSMPGVPHEMQAMMTGYVLPELRLKFNLPAIVHRTILTQGIGESVIAEKIKGWEEDLPKQIKLAYLPSIGMVRLRLSILNSNENSLNEMEKEIEKLLPLIKNYVFGFDTDTLEKRVGEELKVRNATVIATESCTGGKVSHKLTSIPGSSAYFKGGLITYSNELKQDLLKVKTETLRQQGAVSEETVREMAGNACKLFKTDYALATSGIAGPDGGSAEKPVGTVWAAVAGPNGIVTRKFQLGNDRFRVIEVAAQSVLFMLLKEVMKTAK